MPWNDNSGNGDEPPKANGGPWGSGGSGGNGDGNSPWGRPGGGGGGGQGGGSDIEEQMRKMQERFSRRGRGGGGGGLMTGQGVTGALVRTTIIFGAIFFISSLTLTTIATHENADGRTDVQRELESDLPEASETDELGLNNLDDILGGEGSLLDDPLAVTPSETAPASEPESDDPLATEADPQ